MYLCQSLSRVGLDCRCVVFLGSCVCVCKPGSERDSRLSRCLLVPLFEDAVVRLFSKTVNPATGIKSLGCKNNVPQ